MSNYPIVFVHIPKTAGTSFRIALEEAFSKDLIAYDYGEEKSITASFIKNFVYKHKNLQKARQFIDTNNIKVLAGHFNAGKYLNYFDKGVFCTFLRDPVQRVISLYKHFVRHCNYKDDLKTFISQTHVQNEQTKFLNNLPLKDLGFLGITERYRDSLEILNSSFNTKINYKSMNMGRDNLNSQHIEDESIISLIQELNQKDIALYQDGVQEFERRYASLHNEYKEIDVSHSLIGRVNFFNQNTIQGWAVNKNLEKPIQVEVLINGNTIEKIWATRYRPNIQKQGIKRSGNAGFVLNLSCSFQELSNAKIEVRFVDNNQHLLGSPYLIE